MKKILSIVISLILCIGMIGCSKEDLDTSKYFSAQNKKVIDENRNYDYKKITTLETLSMDKYENERIKIAGKVKDLELDEKTLEMWLEVEKNNTPYPLRVIIPSTMVNVKFSEGDTITVYGRFAGLITKNYDDKKVNYYQLSSYFIEKGDTTDVTKNTEKLTNEEDKENNTQEDTSSDTSKTTSTDKKDTSSNNKTKTNKTDSNKATTLNCPNCGREISVSNNIEINCPYCGYYSNTGETEIYDDNYDSNDSNSDNSNNEDKGSAMDSEDGIINQYQDENGNTVIEYEDGSTVIKYND